MDHLNEEQNAAYQLALQTSDSLFLTGFAGTGKTVLMRTILHALKGKGRETRVAAFTGLAARALGGSTLAKLLGLGLSKGPGDFADADLGRAEENLDGITDLFIDEISMVSGDYLALVDQVLQTVIGRAEPFGGLRLIVGGDFMQLSPICKRGEKYTWYWAFEYPSFRYLLPTFLKRSMRHQDAREAGILNEWRQGIITERGLAQFQDMVRPGAPGAVDLYPRRKEVEVINQTRLDATSGRSMIYTTVFDPDHQVDKLLNHIPIGKRVELKRGVPVIILVNDPKGHFVNGSQGHVEYLDPSAARIKLHCGKDVWVPFKTWHIADSVDKVVGRVEGMPVQLGWAATIHRAQGMTLDSVVTDVSRCWEPGQAYVALSRTRKLSDIALLSPVRRIRVDPVALSYVNALIEAS
jgi:ATP-dependent DNA helicase PIF1